jgi:3-deoxy-D-manno-octulosonic acid kinase
MNPVKHTLPSAVIVYDADRLSAPTRDWFDAGWWRAAGRRGEAATGRGEAWMVESDAGPAVLRAYLRGGWPRHLSRDRYVFTGYGRSRPVREFDVLAGLQRLGLPAPAPLAALCERHGAWYTGALLMSRIEAQATLADRLGERYAADPLWARVGACIRRFHEAGAWHADLNVRNVLLGVDGAVSLIDFDRARLTPGRPVAGRGNLERLRRSVAKEWPAASAGAMEQAWQGLEGGYLGQSDV